MGCKMKAVEKNQDYALHTLPKGLAGSQVVLTGRCCYLLGGANDDDVYTNEIFRGHLNANDTITNINTDRLYG
jgi:hypothetical protein